MTEAYVRGFVMYHDALHGPRVFITITTTSLLRIVGINRVLSIRLILQTPPISCPLVCPYILPFTWSFISTL